MASKWYPVVDILSCIECGTCVNFCPHNVYDKNRSPVPNVVRPDACIDHCHGCGNRCPVGAISYVGDDTGWIPEVLKGKVDSGESCGCGCGVPAKKSVLIEYLYLDLQTCDRCMGTDVVLDEVVAQIRPVLTLAGFSIEYRKTEMTTAEIAVEHNFLSSPTIRVNGQDICANISESSCGCCGDISGTDVDCRVFEYEGKSYEVPPKGMLANAVLEAVFSGREDCACEGYALPENLKRFYEGKENRSSQCACGGKCC